MTSFDVIVVGAGMRGLHHALRTRANRPDASLLVVDASPRPGADICTHRSNGFTCELGPFAFTRVELDHILAPLSMPPRIVNRQDQAKTGWLFDGSERRPLRVEPEPLSFVSGCEDVVQSYRRELDTSLRLGRAVTSIRPEEDGGFTVTLGGEVPTELTTREVVLAISTTDAARLLGGIEPELPHVAEQEQREPRAFVHLGGFARTAPELHGYGVLPRPDVESPMSEAIFCTEVFPRRAMPNDFLVRCELSIADSQDGGQQSDDELVKVATDELQRWTLTKAPMRFARVHRFSVPIQDGCQAECRARVGEIAVRVPGISIARAIPDE